LTDAQCNDGSDAVYNRQMYMWDTLYPWESLNFAPDAIYSWISKLDPANSSFKLNLMNNTTVQLLL
jgi:hypothetical protein